MTTRENRLLPLSAIAAMLAVTTTIVGLSYWVGDALAPGLAAVVGVSTTNAGAARAPDTTARQRVITAPAPVDRTKAAPAAPKLAGRTHADAGR